MAEIPSLAWRTTLKRRMAVTAAILVFWALAVQARLVYLQVFRHADLTARAEEQQSDIRDVPAARGKILDRRGEPLAVSVDAVTIEANPRQIADAPKAAAQICAALGNCSAEERQQLTRRLSARRYQAYVRRQVTSEEANRVARLKIQGIRFISEVRRFYPNGELGAHVLGYVGTDHKGLGGVEATYDALISGRPGRVLVHTDAGGTTFRHLVERAPTAGASLELTIDENIQYVVERELRAAVIENRAASGSAIVTDPWTGEILALANYPTFDPNAWRQARPQVRRNRAVQDMYEPGSTFKIVTASAALQEKVIRAGDVLDVSGGKIGFGSDFIYDMHDYKRLTFADAIIKSSNVGAIKVGLQLGGTRLADYITRFGFGRASSPRDFPAESRGIVWNATTLPDRALARVSMGYQVGVTPLQMAAAFSVVANGGELLQPRIVRAVIKDGVRRTVPRTVVRRVIEESTARELTTIMEGVVERGTATLAQIPGYTIAGKTGTAAKLIERRYSKTEYNASFVGFLPSQKPLYTIAVVIDSPHGPNGYYGGPVAAPVFRRIAEVLLRQGAVPPSIDALPPVLVERRPDAVREIPAAGPVARQVAVATSASIVPDMTGLSARDALATLTRLGMTPRMHGTGFVHTQQPAPGAALESGGVATLWLTRQLQSRSADTGVQ